MRHLNLAELQAQLNWHAQQAMNVEEASIEEALGRAVAAVRCARLIIDPDAIDAWDWSLLGGGAA